MESLKSRIRSTSKFMWSQEKGRGTEDDKAALTLGVDRSVISDAKGDDWQEQWATLKGEKEMYRAMPAKQQRLLPGFIRWAQTFKNDNFGLFAYGDEDKWVDDTHDFFFEDIIHGMGIHGRNLTSGSPADRMLFVGMPWIGGVSGSVVDFYFAARDLGYSGKDLA